MNKIHLLFNLLQEINLNGTLEFEEDNQIKWYYDALGDCVDDMDSYLENIYDQDNEIINDIIEDNNLTDYIHVENPSYDYSYVYFNIFE